MANLITVKNISPIIHESCWLADNATITGDVEIGKDSSIWFNVVIRGDVCRIRLGEKVNIQDGVIIHGTIGKSETIIGDRVSIGHGAILHGCILERDILVGMGAIVMDNAVVEPNVIIGAGAVVLENAHLESGYVYAGTPAKKIKPIDPDKLQFHVHRTADAYVKYSSWYRP